MTGQSCTQEGPHPNPPRNGEGALAPRPHPNPLPQERESVFARSTGHFLQVVVGRKSVRPHPNPPRNGEGVSALRPHPNPLPQERESVFAGSTGHFLQVVVGRKSVRPHPNPPRNGEGVMLPQRRAVNPATYAGDGSFSALGSQLNCGSQSPCSAIRSSQRATISSSVKLAAVNGSRNAAR